MSKASYKKQQSELEAKYEEAKAKAEKKHKDAEKTYVWVDIGQGASVQMPKRIYLGHGAWADNPDIPKNIKPNEKE